MSSTGVWELTNYQTLTTKITQFFESKPDVYLNRAVVFGSYGSGSASPDSSDLDILIGVTSSGTVSESERKQFYASLAEELVYETDLIEDLEVSPSIDLLIRDTASIDEVLQQYGTYSNNYQHYDLLQDTRICSKTTETH
jgi:predicted nucleotidyltransferase